MIEIKIIKFTFEQNRALVTFQKFYTDESGISETLGKSYTRQYTMTSETERQRILDELPEETQNAIFVVLGSEVSESDVET